MPEHARKTRLVERHLRHAISHLTSFARMPALCYIARLRSVIGGLMPNVARRARLASELGVSMRLAPPLAQRRSVSAPLTPRRERACRTKPAENGRFRRRAVQGAPRGLAGAVEGSRVGALARTVAGATRGGLAGSRARSMGPRCLARAVEARGVAERG
jgi:hypothetical protein